MEQFRQIGEVLGSMKTLMLFWDQIQINQSQCSLLFDMFNLTFDVVAEEMRQILNFDERLTKWKALEHPLKELHRVFKEGEAYVRRCLETRDWWAKAIFLAQNKDCVELHLHNLLCCVPIVHEAIELAGEISGSDDEEIQKKRLYFSKKYERVWADPKLFQIKFGRQYIVSQDVCRRIENAWREDRWRLLETINKKRSLGSLFLTKQELKIAELLSKILEKSEPHNGKLFPSSFLVGSNNYRLKRRLGNGTHYKEIEWRGESFAVCHIFGDIKSIMPEISRLSTITHPNIMHILCGFSDDEKKECFLLMELMNKDLDSFMREACSPRRRIPFTLPVAVDIMLQIARGMEYLHSRKIYHGDLNTSNILLKTRTSPSDGYLCAKVAGFGQLALNCTSRSSANHASGNTYIWYAPEVLSEQELPGRSCSSKCTAKADVYSFGMICFELLTGKVPFEDGHLQGDKISRNIRTGERPLFPCSTPKYLTNLTRKCWQPEPACRPNFSSICRILRYIKKFIVTNPDHMQPDTSFPPVDYFDIETCLSKKFPSLVGAELAPVSQIPFEMFVYRVVENEKMAANTKEKGSESESEGASVCGDDHLTLQDDPTLSTMVRSRSLPHTNGDLTSRAPAKKLLGGKACKNPGQLMAQSHKGRALRPPQTSLYVRNLRADAECHPRFVTMSPGRRKGSGHASDSELT